MGRIKIADIPKGTKISRRELNNVFGGTERHPIRGMPSSYRTYGSGLNPGDSLLLEYDKNFISTQSEIADAMGKALTELQQSQIARLKYLAR